jgi:dTMP kinase
MTPLWQSTCADCVIGVTKDIELNTGRFITVEGIEGVGKSTNIEHLSRIIESRGFKVLKTREPGGTPMAERIRALLVEHGEEELPDIAELLLMFAARALHVNNVIRPALAAGTWVVCDRFTDASRAYQGGGRGIPMNNINQLADWVHGNLQPDLTILLDAPVDTGLDRAGRRGEPDRIEVERREFFSRVRETYLQLAGSEPERFIVVDATQDLESVRRAVERIALEIE